MIRLYAANVPPVNEKEVLRYARCENADGQMIALLRDCAEEAKAAAKGNICYTVLDCTVSEDICHIGGWEIASKDLARNLFGCRRVILFAATLGIAYDRLIQKYQRLSPAKAVMFHALGAERIEAACDDFCRAMEDVYGQAKPRFSPGYGDVALEGQKEFFRILQPEKHLGLYLNESLLMSPSKSVTAFVGLKEEG